jgi:hypothetical protein
MHKLILGLIYYCSNIPTCFGPLIEAIVRESKILECYKGFMAICLNIVMWIAVECIDVYASHSNHTRCEYIHMTTFKQIAIKPL